MRKILFPILLFPCILSTLPSATYIQAGRLFDGVSNDLREEITVIVEDNRITEIRDGYHSGEPENDTVVQLREQTVLPGLIDLHTHLTLIHSRDFQNEKLYLNPADYALRGAKHAKATLMAGFTTVRDVGDRKNSSVALKKAVNKGWVIGPRIFTSAKAIATTGGHADPTNGFCYHLMGTMEPTEGVINGPYEAREAVRKRYKDGADCIKITATGGVLSLGKSGQNPQFMQDELEAIVETARDYGFTVAVHAHGDEGMRRAVLAGVDTIEHGTFMSKETMELMKERGTYYVPTITAGRWVTEKAEEEGYFPAVVLPKVLSVGPQIQETFAKAYGMGVPIAFGTDTAVSAHGENAQEFLYMVEAGMPAIEALKSATSTAAKVLRRQDEFGSIETGKMADIIAVPGNPVDDISLMQKVSFVMKEGVVYKNDGI
jgi:imidazolonepropionase-like amidohydrolase